MQIVSAAEKAELEKKREDLYKLQLEVQERIRKAAALGDLSENAEYHFAKEENRSIQRQLAELELKLRHLAVVDTSNVPEDLSSSATPSSCWIWTMKANNSSDSSAKPSRLARIVMCCPVSVNSPMGEALMKARVGDKIKVKAPRGTMEFKILAIV